MHYQIRRLSNNYLKAVRTGKSIRRSFIDYFVKDHGHVHVRSSPVVPYCDPTLAFVNAGMNQFKNVFLGKRPVQHKRVANSQKCVRVGGKHNDLNVVGTDGYHHTFFEMLGNWSFGDYFKEDACKLAWEYLRDVCKLDASRLYVTYFSGDRTMDLESDRETYEAWRSIGVPADRLIPFGVEDNFWEMGATGPCGPCTEIHYDYAGGKPLNRARHVNAGRSDLVELWNVVFIEYNRNADGSLTALPTKHIDTGMGLERLTSVVQNVASNYETDIFAKLMRAIETICPHAKPYGNRYDRHDVDGTDTDYRIMADHARMVTVCLADGMIPETNQKLRRVLRKSFHVARERFDRPGLLRDLVDHVVDDLGDAYPELERNVAAVRQIIDYESHVYETQRATTAAEWSRLVATDRRLHGFDAIDVPSGLVAAYKSILSHVDRFDGDVVFRLYDTYGLDGETIARLARCLRIDYDATAFGRQIDRLRERTRVENDASIRATTNGYDGRLATENRRKYDCAVDAAGEYVYAPLDASVVQVYDADGGVVDGGAVPLGVDVDVVLDRTNCYETGGGQESDRGTMRFDGRLRLDIDAVRAVDGVILHRGRFVDEELSPNAKRNNPTSGSQTNPSVNLERVSVIGRSGRLAIEEPRRFAATLNHTGAHLLNAAVRRLKGAACQRSSSVTCRRLTLDMSVYDVANAKFKAADVERLEATINEVIDRRLPVRSRTVTVDELLALDGVTTIPGEVYPDTDIRLITIDDGAGFLSIEPCCGTHALNTGHLRQFRVVNVKSTSRSQTSITCVTGERAVAASRNGVELTEDVDALERSVADNIDEPELLEMAVTALRRRLHFDIEDGDNSTLLPLLVKQRCADRLNTIAKRIKEIAKSNLKDFIEVEMQNAIQTNTSTSTASGRNYLVHYLRSSTILDTVQLQRATKLCKDTLPVLVVAFTERSIRARCCVPRDHVSERFDATQWLRCVATKFNCRVSSSGIDSQFACDLRVKRVDIIEWDALLKAGLDAAHEYARRHL